MNNKVLLIAFHNEKALGARYLARALDQNGFDPYVIFFKGFNSEVPETPTGEEMRLECPLPEDFAAFLAKLRKESEE